MKFNVEISEEKLESILIDKIPEKYDLKIIKRQFKIDGGIIDILAKSTIEDNVYFVIELKVGDLTTDSVCQVLRYTQYLNLEMSKNSKRRFYHLLIGSGIDTQNSNGHLIKLLKHFNGMEDDCFYVQYDLFNVGVNGINLGYYNVENNKIVEEKYKKTESFIEKLYYDLENKEVDLFFLEKKYKRFISFIKDIIPQYMWNKITKEYNENE